MGFYINLNGAFLDLANSEFLLVRKIRVQILRLLVKNRRNIVSNLFVSTSQTFKR
jgi:hypothetical protein